MIANGKNKARDNSGYQTVGAWESDKEQSSNSEC